MKFKSSTSKWRDQYTEAAEHLWRDRESFFSNPRNAEEMRERLVAGKLETLRDIARELRRHGVYSRKTALCKIEFALLKRLHIMLNPGMKWENFVSQTVGMGWFHEARHRLTGAPKQAA